MIEHCHERGAASLTTLRTTYFMGSISKHLKESLEGVWLGESVCCWWIYRTLSFIIQTIHFLIKLWILISIIIVLPLCYYSLPFISLLLAHWAEEYVKTYSR